MSDSDDWEKGLESSDEEEKKKEEEKKRAEFDDEDKVDAEKKKAELEKAAKEKAQAEIEANKKTKKASKIDYDEAFKKRQEALAGIKPSDEASKVDTAGMSKAAKGMLMEIDAEKGLADQLFGGMDLDAPLGNISLNSEKEYKDFGRKTGQLLLQGSAPYRIENFFRELCKDLPEHLNASQIQKIVDFLGIMQKAKAKKEKEERDGKNKKKPKASIAGGGGKGGDLTRNNNVAMINDVMGYDNNDYGDYGDEGAAFKREEEADYDFM